MAAVRISRRQALAALAAPCVTAMPPLLLPAAATGATERITVLYRRETPTAPDRLDPVVQAATLALEAEMLQRGFRVLQPSAETYKVMDQGPAVVVTFAADAGYSMVFSAYKNMRPTPGADAGIAEVRLQARAFLGPNVLAAEEGRGQMLTRLDQGSAEFGERRGMELAARKAAADLADKTARRLKSITPEQIAALPVTPPSSVASAQSVPVPATGAAAAQGGGGGPLPRPAGRWALLVGVSDYAPVRKRGVGAPDLEAPKLDVKNLSKVLVEIGFPKDNITVLEDGAATSRSVSIAMKTLAGRMKPDDLVLLFISGHGVPKDYGVTGYGLPVLSDFDPKNQAAALDFWELQSLARGFPANKSVWLIDTCHSGGAALNMVTMEIGADGVRAGKAAAGPDAQVVARGADRGKHFAVMTSALPEELAWEDNEGGVFLKRVVAGLRATKGDVTIGRLFREFVEKQVMEEGRATCKQQPRKCPTGTQTPRLAVEGLGDQIVL